jgi:hypothetical protein
MRMYICKTLIINKQFNYLSISNRHSGNIFRPTRKHIHKIIKTLSIEIYRNIINKQFN